MLELQSTSDSVSTLFAQKGWHIHLSTPDPSVHAQLQSLYHGVDTVRMVHSINIHRKNTDQPFPDGLAGVFDTVLGLNAMDNGLYDRNIVRNAGHFLNTRGRLILVTPVFTAAYEGFTLELEMLKSFNTKPIRTFLPGMEILRGKYFDLPNDAAYDRSGQSVLIIARKI